MKKSIPFWINDDCLDEARCLDEDDCLDEATVQADCRGCRSDIDEFKAHTAWIDVDDNSAIAGFILIVAQTMQLQIIEVLR